MAFPNHVGCECFKSIQDVVLLEDILDKLEGFEENIVSEACSHFSLVMWEVEAIRVDVEWIWLAVVNLATKINNLSSKVKGIEVMVEETTVGILKDVFGLHDPSSLGEKLLGKHLDQMNSENLVQLTEETSNAWASSEPHEM